MGANSKIAWTDHTFNPWWGCTKVSAGCKNCYAEGTARRFGTIWGDHAPRRLFGDHHWNEPRKWNREAELYGERKRVFCGSMMDVFEDLSYLATQRERLWTTIKETPILDWLLLTKRPENILRTLPEEWIARPRSNVAFGLTVCCNEDIQGIETLLRVPAAMRFLSMEPLLEPVKLPLLKMYTPEEGEPPGIDWVIVGGESGPNARPFIVDWARSIVRQCRSASTPVFVKQLGANCVAESDQGVKLRIRFRDRAGADPAEWPDDLRVREFPIWNKTRTKDQ